MFASGGKLFVFVCAVIGYCHAIKNEKHVEKIYIEKKSINDLDTAATGYIYRSDGNGPPMFIKLGQGNIDQYEKVFKNAGLYSNADKSDYTDNENLFPKSTSEEFHGPKTDSYIFKDSLKSIPFYNSDQSEFPLLGTGKLDKYKVKNEQNYEYSSKIKGPSHDGYSSSEGGYEVVEHENPDTAPVTFFKKNAAGYKEHSQMYFNPSDQNLEKFSKGYVAPFFDAPQSHELKFNQRIAPTKYPVKKTSYRSGYYSAPLLADNVEEYDGEDSGHNSQYIHSDYHHHPKKHHYAKGGGELHKAGHHASHGDKDESGYKKYHDFDEEEMGHHGKDGKKGFHKQHSGYKKDHEDGAKKYGEFHEGSHGEKGTKYDTSTGHKKGHKTSGYHNIFHKDEYKKEHKFYDDAHKQGHHDKHGGHHVEHEKKHGAKESGGHHDSGYDEGEKGSSSKFKKGHFDHDHKGHKGASGHDSSYHHHDDYGKKDGHSEDEKHGYSESDGGHHGYGHH